MSWWRPDTYARIVEISVDKQNFPDTFKEWRKLAQKQFDTLRAEGLPVVKIVIDPDELLAWATSLGRNVDAKTRIEFALRTYERSKGGIN